MEKYTADVLEVSKKATKHFTSKAYKDINIQLRLRISGLDPVFEIVIYDINGRNCTLTYYSFWDDNKIRYDKDIRAIKSDNFEKIYKYAEKRNGAY